MTLDICLPFSVPGGSRCQGAWQAQGKRGRPQTLKSHLMETPLARPLNCHLTETTERIQAACCMVAARPMDRQCQRVCDSWLGACRHPLGSRAWLGLTVFWKSDELRGLAGKADPPGVTGTDSELIRTPGTEVFNDEVSVQGRSYRLLPGLGT